MSNYPEIDAVLAGDESMSNPNGLIYLASPYSDPAPDVMEARFDVVCEAAARLMRDGVNVFSPIAHTHPIAQHGLPKDWTFWSQYDRLYLETCSELWVLMMEGWKESRGVAAEIAIMRLLEKPVRFIDADTLEAMA